MAGERDNGRGWIGIPSVPPERAAQAFASFYTAITAAIVVDVLLITHNHSPATWQLTAEMVFDDGSQILAWALAATWPIMEAMRMVLASIWRERTRRQAREEGREEGIAEGKEEMNRIWADWNRRRQRAESLGEPFNEPAPGETHDGNPA